MSPLTSIIGIALLLFGLIETELREQRHEGELLPENRAVTSIRCNVLSTFQGVGFTYTRAGIPARRRSAVSNRSCG